MKNDKIRTNIKPVKITIVALEYGIKTLDQGEMQVLLQWLIEGMQVDRLGRNWRG
jgi:hypothetical protein